MRRMYIYPEQEPGRERISPFYEEQQRMQEPRQRSRMAYGNYGAGYEGRSYSRRSRMEYDDDSQMYSGQMGYGAEGRMIGFDQRARYSMHGGGHTGGEYEMGKGSAKMHPMSEEEAEDWVYSMKFADGSKAPKFQYKDVEMMLKGKGWNCDPLDVWVGMNALYSDLGKVNAKYGISDEHKDYWLEAACVYWLDDEDAVDDKLTAYYNHVVM